MTASRLKAKETQDTAQTDTKASFSSCPAGTGLVIKGKHLGSRLWGSFRGAGLWDVNTDGFKRPDHRSRGGAVPGPP